MGVGKINFTKTWLVIIISVIFVASTGTAYAGTIFFSNTIALMGNVDVHGILTANQEFVCGHCIDNIDMGGDAVGAVQIIDGAVGTSELAEDSVTAAKIADGTITQANLEEGLFNIYTVRKEMDTTGSNIDIRIHCDDGDIATGGGTQVSGEVNVRSSNPLGVATGMTGATGTTGTVPDGGVATGWRLLGDNLGTSAVSGDAFVLCLDLSPFRP